MKLAELLAALPNARLQGNPDTDIADIHYDSRAVTPGSLFACVPGLRRDGHSYAADAVAAGAVALLAERPLPLDVPQLLVPDARLAMAWAAATFFGHPSRQLLLVGVTGTNGKTTTTHLTEAILAAAGHKTGLIGTVQIKLGDETLPSEMTTPESVDLQRLLRRMADAGVTAVAMEVSSHALSLHRVARCAFDVGIVTNITRDHFDFHADFDDYVNTKARLHQLLAEPAVKPRSPRSAVINADDSQAERLRSQAPEGAVTFGIGHGDVRATAVETGPRGSRFVLEAAGVSQPVTLHLPGLFNVSNALAAAAAGLQFGIDPAAIARALASVRHIPGRYEPIDCGQDFTVLVDFAHNPDALANVLGIPLASPTGRRIAVFGAEGRKDEGKRPLMGEMAMRHADYCIITSDNIYDEDPEKIANEVAAGLSSSGKPPAAEVIIDRRQAIARALAMARRDDLVIIAGKGHETHQVVQDQRRPFDDRTVVRELLQELLRQRRSS